MIQYIIAAGLGALVGSAQRKGKKFAMGGTTGDAEERAFAEYMEDYGVDREEADEQFLGEFDNKEQWAAEYVDDIGGIEQFADPERYLEIDYTGFKEFAMNQAEALSMDLEDYDIEKIAQRHGLAFQYWEAEGRGGVEMENFRARMEEKEYEDSLASIMDEGESVEGVLDLIARYVGGGVEEAIDQHVVEVDYVEVADALEDDGFVFIEKDFKTFVFNLNMARGGRTKRMKKGGKVDYESRTQKDFDLGEIVYNVEEDNYGTIIGMSSHPLEVRLDTDGMQGTSFLRKLGEKGDVGSKAQLFDEVSYYVNIRKQNPERKFPPLINNPFYAKGGKTKGSDHDQMQALKKGDKIRITRLTDNRRTETPILLTLVRKGRVNKGKRNEQSKFKFENESGQTFFAYQRDGEEPSFAFSDMAIIVSDKIDFSPKMARGGKTPVLDADEVLDHFIMAMLFAESDEEGTPLDENYSFDDVNMFTLGNARDLIQKFLHENANVIEKHNLSASFVGHDLWMSPTGQGVGFRDRHRDHPTLTKEEGDALHESSEKIMGTSMYAIVEPYDGSVEIDGFPSRFAKGGKTQGYDDKLDESLGSRKGAGRTKEQSRKDRRDESAAMEKSMGRRKYASVGTMDKGSREMEKGGRITAPQPILDGKEFIALVVDKDGMPQMKFSKTFNGALRMAKNMTKKFDTGAYHVKKFDPIYGAIFLNGGLFIEPTKSFDKGGKTKKRKEVSDFDKLAMKVAARYRAEGKSNKEAMEIGRGTAANVARQQQAKKGKK